MRRCLLLALLLFAAGPVRAVEHALSIEAWADAYGQGTPRTQSWYRMTYALDAQLRPAVFVKLAAIVERESQGDISRDVLYDADDRDLSRAAVRFRDLAVGFRTGDVTIVLGRQRLTWGRTSFVNATDNLTPRDWTDPLDEIRLSPWSADLTWERDRWHAEAAVVPQYAPSRLPQPGSRWFPTLPGASVTWGTAEYPAVTWSTVQEAVRGGYRGGSGEVRVSYFRGYDDAPRITPRPGSSIALDREFPRLEVSGIDGEILLGGWVFRAEAGYFHYPDGEHNGYGLFQVEAEWSRGPWRAVVGYGDTLGGGAAVVATTSLNLAFLPALLLAGTYGEATEWQVSVNAIVGTDAWDSSVKVSGSYPFTGHVRAGGEMNLIRGDATSFWGRWRNNDRMRAFVKFDF